MLCGRAHSPYSLSAQWEGQGVEAAHLFPFQADVDLCAARRNAYRVAYALAELTIHQCCRSTHQVSTHCICVEIPAQTTAPQASVSCSSLHPHPNLASVAPASTLCSLSVRALSRQSLACEHQSTW